MAVVHFVTNPTGTFRLEPKRYEQHEYGIDQNGIKIQSLVQIVQSKPTPGMIFSFFE